MGGPQYQKRYLCEIIIRQEAGGIVGYQSSFVTLLIIVKHLSLFFVLVFSNKFVLVILLQQFPYFFA